MAEAPLFPNRSLRFASRITCLLVALTAIPAGWAGVRIWLDTHNEIASWAADGAATRKTYERLRDLFGGFEYVVISWDGCEIGDPLPTRLAEQIDHRDTAELFTHVWSGGQMLERLTGEPLDLTRRAALRRLTGTFVGPDQQATCVVATLSNHGVADRRAAIDAVRAAANELGLRPSELKLSGSGYLLGRIDEEAISSPLRVIPAILVLVVVLLWYRLASLRLTLAIVVLGLLTANLLMAAVYLAGVKIDAVLSTLPALVFLLFVSNAVHLANYFLSSLDGRDRIDAMRRALTIGWKPTLFSGLTTGLGLLSLVSSQTLPIRQFGLFGAIGVTAGMVLVLLVFPHVAKSWFWRGGDLTRVADAYRRRAVPDAWQRWSRFVFDYRRSILVVAGVLLPVLMAGVLRLTTSVRVDAMFRSGGADVENTRWLEARLGPIDSLEVAIQFPDVSSTRPVDRLLVVDAVERAAGRVDGVAGTFSLTKLSPPLSRGSGFRAAGRRALIDDYLRDNDGELLTSGFFSEDGGSEIWRVSVRVSSFADVEPIRRQVERVIQESAQADAAELDTPVHVELSGAAVLFRDVEAQFLRDMARSYLMGFLVISLTVLLLLRSVAAGALAMVPNAYPAALVLGLVGWMGVTLDVGSIMTASVALGIAVDDTLHFVLWCRRELADGRGVADSLRRSMLHCGSAMAQTSIICGTGLALFAFCTFLPTVRFGTLMSTMLISALVADLTVLPALIAAWPKVWSPRAAEL
jgi:hypothetical protein